MVSANDGDKGEAVDLGHADVENDGVAGVGGEPCLGLGAVCEGGAGVAFAAEIGDEEPVKEAIVVNDEEIHMLGGLGGDGQGIRSIPVKSRGCANGIVSD